MPWFPVDDGFHSHPKATAASLPAIGLWTVAGSWSNHHHTDGFVPDHVISLLSRGDDELARELVAVGLWRRSRGGYRFHQWEADADGTPRNQTRAEAMAKKSRMATGGTLGNHRRWHAEKGITKPGCVYCTGDRVPSGSDDERPLQVSQQTSGGLQSGRMGEGVSGSAQSDDQWEQYRPPDQVPDRVPESGGDSGANRPNPNPNPNPKPYGGTSSQSSYGRNARPRDDDDSKIDTAITRILTEETGVTIAPDWAAKIRHQILDGRHIDKPVTYVSRALRERPRDFLPPGSPAHDGIPPELVGLAPPGERDNPANERGLAAARAALAKPRPEPQDTP